MLLGVLLIALATAATTYLALNRQIFQKRAATTFCLNQCAPVYDGCINDCNINVYTPCANNVDAFCQNECAADPDFQGCVSACQNRPEHLPSCDQQYNECAADCEGPFSAWQACMDQCESPQQDCTSGPVCGPCIPGIPNTCGPGSGSWSCRFTQPQPCTETADFIEACSAECTGGLSCINSVCQDTQETPTPTPPTGQCTGTLTSTGCNLIADWNADDVFGSCNIFIRGPDGDHPFSAECTSHNTPLMLTELTNPPASIVNAPYELHVSNGDISCSGDAPVGTVTVTGCTQQAESCAVDISLSGTQPYQPSSRITATVNGRTTVPNNDWDNVGFFVDGVQQPCTSPSFGNYSCTVDTSTPGQHSLEFRKHITATPVVCTATGQTTFTTTTSTTAGAPRASITVNNVSTPGLVIINVSSATSFRGEATGTNLRGVEIFRARANVDLTLRESWSRVAGSPTACLSGSRTSCTVTGSWTPTTADMGDWVSAVNAYSDLNNDGDSNDPGENCSGNPNIPPADIAAGWVDCGRSGIIDSIPLRVDAAVPTATRTPTLPPGVSPTRTPTPTLPPGVTPTRTPTPTLPPGVTATRTPTPTLLGGTGVPTVTGVPTLGPNATGLFVSLNLEGFTGTFTPPQARRTEPVEVELRSDAGTIPGRGVLAYSDVTRHFEGLVNLGDNVADGEYTLFVKATSYLRSNFGTITIRSRTINFVPFSSERTLLSCDPNNDNIVNMLDIGQVYTDIRRSDINRRSVIDSLVDITRDGFVDIFDHNFCVQNFLKPGA